MTPPITYDDVSQLLKYDPCSGALLWLPRPLGAFTSRRAHSTWTANYCGRPAGAVACADGYISIGVAGRFYKGHRLAWLLFFGCWSDEWLDHINGQRQDNRIANLREATPTINAQNIRWPRADSRTGLIGAFPCVGSRGYFSKIKVNGRQMYLGRFSNPEAAHAAYIAAKRQHHEGNTL